MARDDERRAGSSGRRRFAALVLSCGLVALVWFAPQITARTGLCDRIVPLLLPDYPGQIRFATPRLGWLTPVQLNRFQATDAAGQLVLEADRIRSSRHLLDLVLRGTRGLDLHLYRPRLVCRSRPDGSNLEDTLQGLPGSADRGKGFDRLTLRVEDGVVELHDDQAGLQGRLNDLRLTCQVETDGGPLRISLASRVTATDNSSGDLSAQVEFAPPAAAGDARFSSGSAALKSQQVPLAALQPLLRRFGAPAQISGRLAADVESSWELAGEMPRLDLQGHVGGTRWRVVPPRWLGPQPLQLAGIHSVADIRWEAGQLHVRHCNLDSDLAQFKLQGRLDVDGLWQDGSSLLLTEHDWQLQGRLNLAQLAAQLPQLLRLREDTQVTAGELVVDLTARTDPQARHWEGKLATSDLQATSGGRTLRWARPIEMTLNLHRPIDGELQGRLACHSDFLQVDAEGSASRATVAVQGNLDRLASHIRQLMDLGDLQLAGTWNAGLELDRRTDGQFTANGHALFEDFQLEYPGRRPLREQRLTLALDTSGMADRQGIAQLQHATLRLGSAGDQLNLQLRSPVARPLAQAAWPLSLKLQGQLASWLPRLQPWLPFSGWQVAGGVRLQATASLAADETVIEQAKLTLQQLQASNGQLNIREPQVLLVTAGKWKRATGAIESDLTTLASGSLAIRADRVSIRLPSEDSRPNVQGALAVQADLASLQSWLARGPQGPQTRYVGRLQAQLRTRSDAATTRVDGEATIDQFTAYQPAVPAAVSAKTGSPVQPVRQPGGWTRVWSEPKVVLTGSGSYDRPADRLVMRELAVQSRALTVQQVTAQVEQLSTRALVDISGQCQYDLAAWSRLLLPFPTDAVRISGRGSHPFRIRGPLADALFASPGARPWWTGLDVEAGAAWDHIAAYGLEVGQGELRAAFRDGVLRCDPIQAALNDGRLHISPVLQLDGQGKLLSVGTGRVIEEVKITPEVCQTWLKYVAPLLAGATRAEGQFSVDLQRATVPLQAPRHSDLAGVLTIHAAQIRPGPLAVQLIQIGQQVEAILQRKPPDATLTAARTTQLNIDAQQVRFAVANQRVHHHAFQVQMGDVTIRTSGVVGMDGTLQMVAEIPVRDRWVERDRYLKALRGQSLRIPISGSIRRPKVDQRVLSDITRQMAAGAASSVLEDAVNKGLEKGLHDLFRRGGEGR